MSTISFDAQWLTIANRALLRVGAKALTSLEDGSPSANYCTQLLPQAIDAVLGIYPWRDCLKRAQLAPLATTPAYGYKHQFALPSDFARLKDVQAQIEQGVDVEWSLEGRRICSDAVSVNILYTAQPSNPETLGPVVRDLIVKQLAYLLSVPLIKNDAISNRLMTEYTQALSLAITQDNVSHFSEDTTVEWFDQNR